MAGRCFGGWSIIDWDVKLISCRIFWHPGPFADTAHLPLASACVNHVGERDIFFTAPCPTYYWGHGPCGPGGPSPWYQLKLNASRAKRMKGGRSHFQPGLSIGSWPVTALPGVFINFQEEDNPPCGDASGKRLPESGQRLCRRERTGPALAPQRSWARREPALPGCAGPLLATAAAEMELLQPEEGEPSGMPKGRLQIGRHDLESTWSCFTRGFDNAVQPQEAVHSTCCANPSLSACVLGGTELCSEDAGPRGRRWDSVQDLTRLPRQCL